MSVDSKLVWLLVTVLVTKTLPSLVASQRQPHWLPPQPGGIAVITTVSATVLLLLLQAQNLHIQSVWLSPS
jgi:hypothetical protein